MAVSHIMQPGSFPSFYCDCTSDCFLKKCEEHIPNQLFLIWLSVLHSVEMTGLSQTCLEMLEIKYTVSAIFLGIFLY